MSHEYQYETDRENAAVGPDFEVIDSDDLLPLEESDLEMDLRCSGSFADAQARLARAMDLLTDLALRRPE